MMLLLSQLPLLSFPCPAFVPLREVLHEAPMFCSGHAAWAAVGVSHASIPTASRNTSQRVPVERFVSPATTRVSRLQAIRFI
jgi:hypothetical protein